MGGIRAGTQRAGSRDKRVKLKRSVDTRDSYGGVEQQWIVYATPWAREIPVRLSEMFMNASERSSQIRRFNIPFRRDISPKDRLEYEGYNYDIIGINEVGRGQSTDIEARLLL